MVPSVTRLLNCASTLLYPTVLMLVMLSATVAIALDCAERPETPA